MNYHLINDFELICKIIVVLSAIAAAWFEFRNRWQTEKENEKIHELYGRKWRILKSTGLLNLPEIVIKWFLDTIYKVSSKWMARLHKSFKFKTANIFRGMVICAAIGIYIHYGLIASVIITIPIATLAIIISLKNSIRNYLARKWYYQLLIGIVGICWLITIFTWLSIILELDILYASIVTLILFPLYAIIIPFSIYLIFAALKKFKQFNSDTLEYNLFTFGFSVTFSILLTIFSLLFGHYANPTSLVPKTLQILFSNVFFDGLTVLFTIYILSYVINRKLVKLLPVAIIIDFIIAALFACSSLYFGLLLSDMELSLKEVLLILIGKTSIGSSTDFGSYFWVMHTTFIPTVFYLFVILLCWSSKMVVIPIAKILRKGEIVEKPHQLTAGAFFLLSTIFAAIAVGLSYID